MKSLKFFIFSLIIILFIYISLTIISPNKRKSIITTKATIIEKNVDIKYNYTITVLRSNRSENNPIVIHVNNEDIWNLLIEGNDYLLVYDATDKNNCYLIQIKNLDS